MPDCGLAVLCGCDFAVLPGHPSDLAGDFHSVPAVSGSGDMLERRPVRHSGYAGIIRAIAYADVHSAIVADDLHLHHGKLLRFRIRLRPLLDIVIRNSCHQGGVRLIAVLTVLFQPGLLLESLHSGFRLAAEIPVKRQPCAELVQQFLQRFHVGTGRPFLQQAAAQRVRDHFGRLGGAGIAVINKCQQPLCAA